MIAENLLGDIFEECIPLFIALGDRTRLTILQCLFETQTTGEGRIPGLNVNEITDRTSLPPCCLSPFKDLKRYRPDQCFKKRRV